MDQDILDPIRHQLTQAADPQTQKSFQRFFKEEVKFYGVKSAQVVQIAREAFKQVKDLPKEKVFEICEDLLKSGFCEEAWIAANFSYWYQHFEPSDFKIYERWIIKYIDNWAECDTFCNHTVGAFIEKYPQYLTNLKTWPKSSNRWLRRASAVSLIIPAKEGKFLPEIFEITDNLLLDPDNMVQKGYGWLLKEASRKHQPEVFRYVLSNKSSMSRIALRYAIEKMPSNLKQQAMEK